MTKDLTVGSPLNAIVSFGVPVFFGNLFHIGVFGTSLATVISQAASPAVRIQAVFTQELETLTLRGHLALARLLPRAVK